MITNYETQYMDIVKNVMENGYYDQNRTGVATKKLPHQIIQVDLEKEFPILKTKQVFWKTATREIMWIMQTQSNNINDLVGHIWDEWADKDGSIGKAYGYQVKEYNQIDNLIKSLKENPQDRRMMINLWNWKDLPEMNLAPCCFLSMWDVTDGRLNCMLVQRSGDLPLGVPFNTTQYAILTHLIAQSCGLKVGMLTHVINNAHIYQNQFEGIFEQLERYEKLQNPYMSENDILSIYKSCPILELNKSLDDFYKFTIDDIKVIEYKHMGRIDMPVSV